MTTCVLSRLPLGRTALVALVVALCAAAQANAVCVGDCDGDGRVSIANLQACVNRGSGLPAPSCAAADQNNDGNVDPNEVDACVQSFLDSATCPMVFTPAPTNTVAKTNTPVPSPTITNTAAPTSTLTKAPTNTPTPTNTAAPTNTVAPLGEHVCTLTTGSALDLETAALPLSLVPTGTFSINCGAPGAGGIAACACQLLQFGAVVIPAIGDVCVNPASGCEPGKIDCDGGEKLDVNLNADHNIGDCTTNAACEASCNAHCAALGQGFAVQSFGCEGYCQGGSNDGAECARDSECPGGQCPGGEPVSHFDKCNCTCSASGIGDPSLAGGLSCNLGTQINVELPSNGHCGDTATIQLPPVCGAVTTETSTGVVKNANNTANATIPKNGPSVVDGNRVSCANFQAGTLTSLKMVGQLGFYDSTLGDIRSGNTFVCQ